MKGVFLDYKIVTTAPLHQGASESYGTFKPFNRERIILPKPIHVNTMFGKENRKLRRQAISLILLKLWNEMEDKGRVTIYDELADKLLASCAAQTKYQFLNMLCAKLKVRSVTEKTDLDSGKLDIVDLLELFDDEELLETIRKEHQYIIAVFRKLKDLSIEYKKALPKTEKEKARVHTLFDKRIDLQSGDIATVTPDPVAQIEEQLAQIIANPKNEVDFVKQADNVPFVTGNGIRGLLRRLCMYDFFKRIGISKEMDSNIDSVPYHLLFTGGTIDSGTGVENIAQRENLIHLCPMLGLFGSAIGNGTIQGTLLVGAATLDCKERGNSEISYHQQLDILFGTRLDSEKLERELRVIRVETEGKKETHQMKYEYEVIITGATLSHFIGVNSDDALAKSAFWHLMSLFKQNNFVCAKKSVGHGHIDLEEIQIHEGATDLYLQHIEENKYEMYGFWKQFVEAKPEKAETAKVVAGKKEKPKFDIDTLFNSKTVDE